MTAAQIGASTLPGAHHFGYSSLKRQKKSRLSDECRRNSMEKLGITPLSADQLFEQGGRFGFFLE
jgi:hypothetical protein